MFSTAAKACARAVATIQNRWREFAGRDVERPLASLVRAYLSKDHRDTPGEGCVVAALGADAARAGSAVRASLEDGVKTYADYLESLLPQDAANRRQRALAIASTMVGALILARAVNDEALSKEILDAATRDILDRPEAAPEGRLS